LKNSLIVASRYAALRKQFGREDNEEYPILNYPTTQMRLIPGLAENFAYRFAGFDLVSRWLECIVKLFFNVSLSSPTLKMTKSSKFTLSFLALNQSLLHVFSTEFKAAEKFSEDMGTLDST